MLVGTIAPIPYLRHGKGIQLVYGEFLDNESYLDFYQETELPLVLDYSPKLPRRYNVVRYSLQTMKLDVDYTILPSIDYSAPFTKEMSETFLRIAEPKNPIGVLQGSTLEELSSCYEWLRGICDIVGLASPLETIARRDEIIRDLGIKKKVFYLEVYKDPFQEIPPQDALGICTSYPSRLASDLRRLEEFRPTPRPLDFLSNGTIEDLLVKNIDEYLEVVRCQY